MEGGAPGEVLRFLGPLKGTVEPILVLFLFLPIPGHEVLLPRLLETVHINFNMGPEAPGPLGHGAKPPGTISQK